MVGASGSLVFCFRRGLFLMAVFRVFVFFLFYLKWFLVIQVKKNRRLFVFDSYLGCFFHIIGLFGLGFGDVLIMLGLT